jgi:hypothetical protein
MSALKLAERGRFELRYPSGYGRFRGGASSQGLRNTPLLRPLALRAGGGARSSIHHEPLPIAGGEGEIRTPDTLPGMAAFEAARFNRSRTSPRR